ncbi:TPA: DUF551 domain-containing protein [Klebsiella pneumoniae]
MTTDTTKLAQSHELLIANGQQTADLLRHLADNEIDSDYFAVVSECESYGKETDAELSITEFALRAAGYVDALVEALEKAKGMETYWKTQCRGITDHCEELQARIAELESHTVKPPVHPTVASENLDDETLQELIEFRRTTFEYHSKEGNKVQTIIHGVTLAALRELQERRKADSEPVAEVVSIYGDHEAFGEREIRPLVGIQQMPYGTKLYRHAQTAPIVQCPYPCGWDTLNKLAIQDAAFVALALVAGEPATESIRSAVISNNDRLLKVISFCRDMMPQSGNSPVIPDRWIPVSERMPEPGILVLVYTPPQPDDYPWDVRIGFDYIDPDGDDPTYWFNHGENYEEFYCVACDGMTGPSEKAPYTHWIPLPAAPQEVK